MRRDDDVRTSLDLFCNRSACRLFELLSAVAADTLKVRLDWTPWGNQAPMHFAAQKGLFKKYDLDVTLDDGNGSVSTVQIVGNGEYDIGHASLAPMVIARSKGLPVKAFAGFVQRNDIGLLVPVDSDIRSPADLKGKKIAFTAGSLEAPFIDRFLAAGKLTRNDVELLNVSAAAKAGTYVAGAADGAFSSVPFFLPVVSSKRPSTSLNFADYGLQFPSFGLFATDKTSRPRRLRFVDLPASYRGAGLTSWTIMSTKACRPSLLRVRRPSSIPTCCASRSKVYEPFRERRRPRTNRLE